MTLPKSKLRKSFLIKIGAMVGADGFSVQESDRWSYSRDASAQLVVADRNAANLSCPAVIVWPQNAIQIAQLIKLAEQFKTPVVAYGGGTGTSGGSILKNSLLIDTKRMQKILQIDTNQLIVEAEAGLLIHTLENRLQRRGFTLGLNDLEVATATIGDVIAGRKDNASSSSFGPLYENIIDLEFVDGLGKTWQTLDVTRLGGLDFNHIITGSRGTMGIITKARLKIFARPSHHKLSSWRFANMKYGIEAMRRIVQAGLKPSHLKLHDEFSTFFHSGHLYREHLTKTMSQIPWVGEILSVFSGPLLDPDHLLSAQLTSLLPEITNMLNGGTTLTAEFSGIQKIIEHEMRLARKICEGLDGKMRDDMISHDFFNRQKKSAFLKPELARKGLLTSTTSIVGTWDTLCKLEKNLKKMFKRKLIFWGEIAQADAHGAALKLTLVVPMPTTLSTSPLQEIRQMINKTAEQHGCCIRQEVNQAMPYLFGKLKSLFDPHGILHPGIFPHVEVPQEDYAATG